MKIDLTDRTYTAEVLRLNPKTTRRNSAIPSAATIILNNCLSDGQKMEIQTGDIDKVTVYHGFVRSHREYHRMQREIKDADGNLIWIPRRESKRNGWLYDVLIAHSLNHLVIAVPFHELAEEVFPALDEQLGGASIQYEKLDITKIVTELSHKDDGVIMKSTTGQLIGLRITKCHLKYKTPLGQQCPLQSVRLTGADLGKCSEYTNLIKPLVSHGRDDSSSIKPVVLGFALVEDGVKKCSATTDQHGNFKISVAPGLRNFSRLFWMLNAIEQLQDVRSSTPNVPILQSKAIKEHED